MPSTPSTRLRVELQALGENLSTWGDTRLNDALKRLEEGIAQVAQIAVTGDYSLTSSNYVTDEARAAVLVLSGSGGASYTLTIPSVEKSYFVANNTDASQLIKTDSGAAASVRSGQLSFVYCDGTDTYCADPTLDQIRPPAGSLSVAGQKITDLPPGTNPLDAVNYQQWLNLRAYAQGIGNSGILAPGTTTGWFLKWNGTGWVESAIPPLVSGTGTTVSGSFTDGNMAVNVDLTTPFDFLFTLSIARP